MEEKTYRVRSGYWFGLVFNSLFFVLFWTVIYFLFPSNFEGPKNYTIAALIIYFSLRIIYLILFGVLFSIKVKKEKMECTTVFDSYEMSWLEVEKISFVDSGAGKLIYIGGDGMAGGLRIQSTNFWSSKYITIQSMEKKDVIDLITTMLKNNGAIKVDPLIEKFLRINRA